MKGVAILIPNIGCTWRYLVLEELSVERVQKKAEEKVTLDLQ